MDAFPAYVPLKDQTVVIVGDGPAAEARARLFESAPSQLVRLSAEDANRADAFAGARLVFIASGGDGVRALAGRARAAGAWVNVVDRPELCDFVTPAVIDRGSVVAAVGTGGAAPLLASLLRADIEARIPPGAGRAAALLARLQSEIRARLPDVAQRRRFLKAALEGEAGAAAMSGRIADAEAQLRADLAAWTPDTRPGPVSVLDGRAEAERLSLRALRRLAAADVLAVGPDANPETLSLARRDATRVALAGADLAALAAGGAAVVCLGPPDPDQARALAAAGIAFETLGLADGAT